MALLVSGAALLCVPLLAQDNAFSQADKQFVKQATEGSNAEIALGNLAQEKAKSEDVKQFGQKMVSDHTNLNQQMQPVAQQMGLSLSPDEMDAKSKATEAKLKMLSGDAFDKAYIKAMVADHHEDLAKFKREIATTKNSDLKTSVEQGKQTIQEHLDLAEKLAKDHNVATGGNSSAGR